MKSQVILVPLFGIPGGGKGSVMSNLKQMAEIDFDISVIPVEMGTYFRKRAETDGAIKDIMDSGGLISNSLADQVFEKLLNSAIASPLIKGEKTKTIVILDGYPRTIPQWEHFLNYRAENNLSVAAIFIELSEAIVMHRSTIRRICRNCGKTFSAEEHLICPHCGKSAGIRRADDLKMRRRIEVFKKETAPVIEAAKNSFEHRIIVNGENTTLASHLVWEFLQTL